MSLGACDQDIVRGGRWQYRHLAYREPQRNSPPQRYVGASWTNEVGYGREGWGAERRPRGNACSDERTLRVNQASQAA